MFCSKCGAEIADDALFCFRCGSKVAESKAVEITTMSAKAMHPSATDIKEYLSHAKSLEVTRYTLGIAKDKLQAKINSLGHKRQISKPVSNAEKGFHFFWSIFWAILIIGILITAISSGDFLSSILIIVSIVLLFFSPHLLAGVAISFAAAFGTGIIAGIIACIISAIEKRAKYSKRLKKYKEEIYRDEQRVAGEIEQIRLLKKQQNELTDEIAKVEAVLKKLYSIGIIYADYRGLVPIVTLYQYFDSGRCQDLPTAYNMYASESILKDIASKLDQAILLLSEIRDTQYMLYEALQEANATAERIYRQSEAMLASTRSIERNTEIAAYHAKIAADNTTISAYIDFCHF